MEKEQKPKAEEKINNKTESVKNSDNGEKKTETKIEEKMEIETETKPTPINTTPLDLSVNTIQSNMDEIVTEAGIPIFAKKSFLTTVPKIEGNKIIFQADSAFHQEKLISPGVKIPLQKACIKIFNQTIEIDFIKTALHRAVKTENTNVASSNDFLTF